MFNFKKWLYKQSRISKLNRIIWDNEFQMAIQRTFVEEAEKNLEKIDNGIEMEKDFIREMITSKDYDSEKKKRESEKKAEDLIKLRGEQEKQIESGENNIDKIGENISKAEKTILLVKKLF